jgi:MYXO-CTERM domain-containing protein
MHTKKNTMSRSITLGAALIVGSIAASAQAAVVMWNVNTVIGSDGSERNYFDVFNQVHHTTDQSGPGVSYNFNTWCNPWFGTVGFEEYLGSSMGAEFAVTNTGFIYNATNGSSVDFSLLYQPYYGVISDSTGFNLNSTNNYVGFRIDDGDGQYNYGWLQIELFSTVDAPGTKIIGIAYESVKGTAIAVPSVPVPGPAATALLAVAGLVGSRRRRA